MTPRQRRDHKIGNQARKLAILRAGHQHMYGGVCQNGRHTAEVSKAFLKRFGRPSR